MKSLTAIAMIIISAVAMSAHADALFEDAYLSDLHVIEIDKKAGWAVVQDRLGSQGEVMVGDTIGWEQAVVVDIQPAAITVEQEELRTRMPMVDPFAGN